MRMPTDEMSKIAYRGIVAQARFESSLAERLDAALCQLNHVGVVASSSSAVEHHGPLLSELSAHVVSLAPSYRLGRSPSAPAKGRHTLAYAARSSRDRVRIHLCGLCVCVPHPVLDRVKRHAASSHAGPEGVAQLVEGDPPHVRPLGRLLEAAHELRAVERSVPR
jgi:hypothetical protein